MKKLLTILTLLIASVTSYATETDLTTSGVPLTLVSDWSAYMTIDKGQFSSAKAGDVLTVYVSNVAEGAQISLKDQSDGWPALEESTQYPSVATTATTYTYTFTETTIAKVKANSMVIGGHDLTITRVTLTSEASFTPAENETVLSVADGSSALPLTLLSDWSAFTTFAATSFSSVKAGDVITVYVSDVEEGAQISLKDMSDGWPALDESTQYPSVATTDTKYTYTLTETTATKVKSNGLVVGGQKLTVVRVTLTSTPASTTQYTLTVTEPTNGTIAVSTDGGTTSTDERTFDAGTQLTLTATPATEYSFTKWTIGGTDYTDNPYSFTINEATTVAATFTANSIPAFSLDGFTADDGNTYDTSTHALTTASGWTGMNLWIGDNSTYSGSKLVVRTSTASKLKVMVYYVGEDSPAEMMDSEALTAHSLTLDNTKKIKSVIIQNQEAGTVTFTEMTLDPTYTLTITEPSNGSFTVNDGTNNLATGASVAYGTTLTLTATPATDYAFTKWTVNGTDYTDNPQSITMTEATTVAATFTATAIPAFSLDGFTADSGNTYDATNHALTTASGWTGMNLWIGENSTYSGSKLVVRTSTASKLKVMVYFVGVESPAEMMDSEAATAHVLTLDNTKKIKSVIIQNQEAGTVTFSEMALDPTYTLTITEPSNGSFTVNDGTNNLATGASVAYGTTLTLTATPATDNSFTKWTVNGTDYTDNPQSITMTEATTVAATFTANPVGTPVFDENGKANLSKFVSDGTAGYSYDDGKGTITTGAGQTYKGVILTLGENDYVQGTKLICKFQSATSAQIHANYVGAEWADGAQVSTTGTTIIVPLDATKQVNRIDIQLWNENTTAVLTEVSISNKCTLTVSATNGSVAVKKGETATTETEFDYGTSLTLTATPASSDYSFKQWVIGVIGETTKTDNPYTFTITSDTEITAEFKSADEDVIWIGSQAINWNSGISQSIDVTAANNLNIADCLIFTITPTVEGVDWPQIQLSSKSDGTPVLTGVANTAITASTTEVKYYVTKAMLSDITTNGGFVVSGVGFTLTKVRIERGNGGSGYENAIWIGEKVFPSNWSEYQTIGKGLFANAVVGDVIRLKYKDVKSGSSINFNYDNSGWTSLPDAAATTADGISTKLTITADMLTALQSGGLIISGINFTLTSVDLVDGSSIKELNCSVPVTGDDWVWEASEAPEFTVSIANNNNEAVTADAQLIVTTDKLVAFKTLTQSKEIAANGSATLTFKLESDNKPTTASFYRATVIVNDETVRTFNFGFDPTHISSPADKQSDFDSYWATAKTQLDAVISNDTPVLTEVTDKSTSKRKVYLVEFKSIPDGTSGDPITIRGYYCEPTDGQKHPVIMHYQGYDSFTYGPGGTAPEVYCPSGDDQPDYAEFVLSTRGQALNNREPYLSNGGNPYGQDGWFSANFGDKDKYYYRGAYMDVVRAIEFMATRETSDMDNLFAEGQSQGGAFTYAAAALSGYAFKAIAPAITFMGDFPDYFDLASWPGNEARQKQADLGWTDAQLYAFMSYYDTKNLATKISCPVITSIGVQDNVCPPHTNIAPYNNVTTDASKKKVIFNAELYHATNSNWNTDVMNFFKSYTSTAADNRTEKTMVEKSQAIADGDITINHGLFANAVVGDEIRIYAEVQSDAKIALEPSDYSGALDGANWASFTESPFTLKLTSALLTTVKAKDLLVRGEKYTFKKAVLFTENELGQESAEEEQEEEDDEDTIFDEKGEADLTELKGQDEKTTVTNNSDGSVTITTTEPYKAAQIWFNDPEKVTGNVLRVEIVESNVDVTVTVKYTDGSQSQMSSTTSASARAMTRASSGTIIKVPVETGKSIQSIEVKNAKAGTITVKKMAMVTQSVFDTDGEADLSMLKPQSNATYDVSTHTLATTQGWTGATLTPLSSESVSGEELLVRFSSSAQVKVAVKYRTNVDGPSTIMDAPATSVRLTIDKTKAIQEVTIQPTTASILTFQEIKVNSTATKDDVEQIFNNGKADLSKFVAQDASKTIYDKDKHIIRATEGWTGVELNLSEGQEVSGKELKISFSGEARVKVNVTYTDGKTTSLIMEDPDEVLRMEIDGGKKIRKIEIQPTEPGNITLKEVAVNKEPEDISLKENETRDLWMSGSGETLTWTETAHQKKSVGSLLQEFDEVLITISGLSGSEWPKVFLRDLQSNQIGKEIELNGVETFPYVVRIPLNSPMAEQIQKGFCICGDGVTVTKLQVYRPYAPKKGDIHLKALDYGYGSSYDATTYTITTTTRWAARGWEIGDMRYNSKDLVIVRFEAVDFPVTIKMEYVDGNGQKQANSTGVAAGNTTVQMAIPEGIKQLDKVYLIFQNPGSITMTEATVVTKAEAHSRGFINDGTDGTTGIEAITPAYSEDEEGWYDLNGRRVEKPGKGIFIRNGKKTVIK